MACRDGSDWIFEWSEPDPRRSEREEVKAKLEHMIMETDLKPPLREVVRKVHEYQVRWYGEWLHA